MGAPLAIIGAIGACTHGARRYESGMKIPRTSAGLAGIAVFLLATFSASASPPPAPDAVDLAQQGNDVAWAGLSRPQLFLAVTVPLLLARVGLQWRRGAYRLAPPPRQRVSA